MKVERCPLCGSPLNAVQSYSMEHLGEGSNEVTWITRCSRYPSCVWDSENYHLVHPVEK